MKKILFGLLLFTCITPAFASEWDLPGIEIISRKERGADESIRYTQMSYAERKARLNSKSEEEMKRLEEINPEEFFEKQKESRQTEYERLMRNDYLQTNYSNEQKVDKVVYQNGLNYLKRPQSYHYEKNKIIVHHTASDSSSFTGKESVTKYIKDVYIYHAKRNGRGDIGYNFLIDPYGNIYEGRAGGDSVIGAHALWNNTPSIGISLMGNFDIQKPTSEQIKSLVSLIAVLSKKYNIDPTAKAEYHKVLSDIPYMKSVQAGTIAGHRDAGITSCPGKNLYSLLPQIKTMVMQTMAKGVLVSSTEVMKSLPTVKTIKKTATNTKKGLDLLKNWLPAYDNISTAFQKEYIKKKGTKKATTSMNKISAKISLDEAKQYLNSDISVLLYELSMNFTNWDISCSSTCYFVTPSGTHQATLANIEIAEGGLLLQLNGKKYLESNIKIQTKSNEIIEIKNYSRVSYYKVPRNTFYGSLSFEKGQIKNLKTGKFDTQYTVVNTLPFHQYLKGIVETNDSENNEKIKAMNLISKGYALFYMNKKNKHPSIPDLAKYTAIDSPDMFQKYVGAGLEKTLKTVPNLVDQQKNELIVYDNYLPILPYFNCSAGFTRSAKDKRGWSDTPYLVSRVDIEKCSDFNGHGVGLSGKGAQFFAQNGWTYKDILNYYYPGIQIITL
ncbi:MAG: N-acetylmuramoyl-L-alanine amidase [Candidatus Absconditabacteria bacterium]|nr:N-acetylmuramoyl-L-alanine amidase [Candidatus Absconditabacteria bacterium]